MENIAGSMKLQNPQSKVSDTTLLIIAFDWYSKETELN